MLLPVLDLIGVARTSAALTGMAVCAALRFAAIWWGLQLPIFHFIDDEASRESYR